MLNNNPSSPDEAGPRKSRTPRVVIVGGGFGGLAAAKALRKAPTRNILIDRTNHHLFQPLLYQVATSVLGPSQISSPIRGILRKQKNTTVIMGEVTGVDKEQNSVFVNSPDREHESSPVSAIALSGGDISAGPVTDQFSNPWDIAQAEEHDGDHDGPSTD